MAWRTYTQIKKRYWEGSDWPPEISQPTREYGHMAGWTAADWAACRNVSPSDHLDACLDNLGPFQHPVPATVMVEMIELTWERDDGKVGGTMLAAVEAGVPLCVARLIAHDWRAGHPLTTGRSQNGWAC